MPLQLTKRDFRAVFAKLRSYLADGKEPDEIAVLIGISFDDYEELLQRFYAAESDLVRGRTTEQTYVDYCLNQAANIRDLTKILGSFEDTKQHSAMVGAIRARSDIYDKIILRGQEFGFIEKKPETKIVAGMIVSQLSTKELRSTITQELSQLDAMMRKFGDAPDIIDVKVDRLHLPASKQKAMATDDEGEAEVVVPVSGSSVPRRAPRAQPSGAPVAAAKPSQVKKHSRNAVHGGRRAVKKIKDEAPL